MQKAVLKSYDYDQICKICQIPWNTWGTENRLMVSVYIQGGTKQHWVLSIVLSLS